MSHFHLPYDTTGTLQNIIKGHTIKVIQLGHRRFPGTEIDGMVYTSVSAETIKDLGLVIQRKKKGGNSETHSRTIWRELVDRYRAGDTTVKFDRENKE